jgi:uncharacterized protein YjaZ
MDLAAANGHFEIVEWLYGNRPEGCSNWASELAYANGYTRISNWLKTHKHTSYRRMMLQMYIGLKNTGLYLKTKL